MPRKHFSSNHHTEYLIICSSHSIIFRTAFCFLFFFFLCEKKKKSHLCTILVSVILYNFPFLVRHTQSPSMSISTILFHIFFCSSIYSSHILLVLMLLLFLNSSSAIIMCRHLQWGFGPFNNSSVDKVGLKQTIQNNDNDARARSYQFQCVEFFFSAFRLFPFSSFFTSLIIRFHVPTVHTNHGDAKFLTRAHFNFTKVKKKKQKCTEIDETKSNNRKKPKNV